MPEQWTLGSRALTDRAPGGGWQTPVLANKAPDGDMMPAQAFASTAEGSIERARLIASAPDLLAAAKRSLQTLTILCEHYGDEARIKGWNEWREQVAAAIAKATE